MDSRDAAALESLVSLVAQDYGYNCHDAGDELLLDGPRRLHVGMANLRQLARVVPQEDWPALVADHVSTIISAVEDPLDLSDFDRIRHLLRSRAYPPEADTGRMVTQPLTSGLLEVLVVDTPTTVRTVVTDETRPWPSSSSDVFTLGRANVRSDGPLDREDFELDGALVSVMHGFTFYAATHLMWLGDYLDIGSRGALAIAPNRSMIAAHVIEDSSAPAAACGLGALARRAYEEGPGSLSPHLYWWRAGSMTRIDPRVDGHAGTSPDSFVELLARSTR